MADPGQRPVDLVVRADRVVSPDLDLDGPGAVAIDGGRIVANGPEAVDRPARRVVDLGDAVLLPGLVDLHTHPDKRPDGSRYGIDPDREILPRGTTTMLSQGDAGSSDLQAYRAATIGPSRARILLALNLSRHGEQGDAPALEDDATIDGDRIARAAARDTGGRLWGIAVNTARAVTGRNDPRRVLARALEIAERVDGPLLFGSRREEDVPLEEQLALLRPGDVVTYCFTGGPENLLDEGGQVRASAREARERGVLFDVGHGMMSFDFAVAEAAIAQGFPPDTISTDQYRRHVGSVPQHDLPRTISKLIAAGMDEKAAFGAATWRPAGVLGVASELGTLTPNALGDLCGIRWNPDGQLADTSGATRPGGCWEPVFVALSGEVIVAPEA